MHDEQQNSTSFMPAMLGSVALAIVVRSWGLMSQVFSNDEIIDLQIARSSWSEITYLADGFPPLHHLILKFVLLLTDWDMAGRWLCLSYGVLAVPIVGLLARRIAGSRCGTIAAFVLAISPMHAFYTQECRSYALYFLVTALAAWLFWRALQIGSASAWTAFACAASIGGYVHYYFCFVLLAFALIWARQAITSGNWRPGLLAFLGLSVLQLPIFYLVGSDIACQQGMLQGDFKPLALGYTGWTFLAGFAVGPSSRELHVMGGSAALREILPWLPLVGSLAAGIFVSLLRREYPYRLELLTLLILPIVCASGLAAGFQLSNYNVRYVLPSLVPLVIMISVAIGKANSRLFSVGLALVLLTISSVSLANRQLVGRYRNEDSRSAAEYIAASESEPSPVYTVAFYMQESARYYLPDRYQVYPVAQITAEPETLADALALINQRQGPYWLFYSREFHGDPEGIFEQALLNDSQVELMDTWEGVQLYRGVSPLSPQPEPLSP